MITDRHYGYLAGALILGEKSPIIKDLHIYQSGFLLKNTEDLKIVEIQAMYEGSRRDIKRRILFPTGNIIETSHTATNDISQVITLVNSANNVRMSDTLFNDSDFTYNKHEWSKTLLSLIDRIVALFKVIHTEDKYGIPTLIEDFPNIAGVLIMHPVVLKKGIVSDRHNKD